MFWSINEKTRKLFHKFWIKKFLYNGGDLEVGNVSPFIVHHQISQLFKTASEPTKKTYWRTWPWHEAQTPKPKTFTKFGLQTHQTFRPLSGCLSLNKFDLCIYATCVLMQPKVFMTWYEDFFFCMILYGKGASCYHYYQGTEDFFFQSITKELADAAQWNRLTVQKRPIINLHSNTNF